MNIINPVKNVVIEPQTDVVIETEIKLNDGKLPKIQLIGTFGNSENSVMKLVSQKGSVYRHQYVLKNISRGNYSLAVLLTNDSGEITNSANLAFTVAEKPTVQVAVKDNQKIFKENDLIQLSVQAFNDLGAMGGAVVFVNGKAEHFTWRDDDNGRHQNGYLYGLGKGTYTITAKVRDDLQIETESEPLTIVVK